MPTYNYKCAKCGSTDSQVVAINDPLVAPKCLSCKKDMDRVFAAPNITFKGGGWGSSR